MHRKKHSACGRYCYFCTLAFLSGAPMDDTASNECQSVGIYSQNGLRAFLLISCSAFGATAHDEAHQAFMTLPPLVRSFKREH